MACYDEDMFIDIGDSQESLTCPIGHGIFNDPHTDPCGHTFCRGCILQSLEVNGYCPISKVDIYMESLEKNENIGGWISSLECKCRNFEEGCPWNGIVSNLADHIEIKCEYEEVQCSIQGCTKMIQRRDKSSHENSCVYIKYPCNQCQKPIEKFRTVFHKASECLETEISCSLFCPIKFLRKHKRFHDVYQCEKVKRPQKVQFKDLENIKPGDFF